jgi:CDP-diacylglycerol--glycerol-3-phosphate 3-phosphatidyltransferase
MLGVGRHLAKLGLTPNLLTLIGLALNAGVAIVLGLGQPQLGGVLLLIASAFDMLDGAVARATNSVTRFGGFLDSTLDRYSEVVVFGGLLYYLLGTDDAEIGSILIFVSATGSLLISYARARAESAGYGASVGLVARPERVILLAICLLIGQPLWALWILAITTHLTAIMRILHVWRMSQQTGPSVAATGTDR